MEENPVDSLSQQEISNFFNTFRATDILGQQSQGTISFVRKLTELADPKVNFSGIDGVIYLGNTSAFGSHAEALPLNSNSSNFYWQPINTNENPILNAILINQFTSPQIVAHETMHLFGLEDLYSSRPNYLSLMGSENAPYLLNYEKWLLGWLDDSNVQCMDISNVDQTTPRNEINIDNKLDSTLVIVKTTQKTAYFIETLKGKNSQRYLVFSYLDIELRPPLTFFKVKKVLLKGQQLTLNDFNINFDDFLNISGPGAIGSKLSSPDFTLLLEDINSKAITVYLIPKDLENSSSAAELYTRALTNRHILESRMPSKCVKGKIVKYLILSNSKCPAGFTRKK